MYHCIWLITLLVVLSSAAAETLYRWTDLSGVVRYGYQPPLGIQAMPAEEERRELMKRAPSVRCQELAAGHLRLIDKEIARIKATPAGLGLAYKLTPAAKRELILDLLAHRAALITGRNASDFRLPKRYKLDRLLAHYEQEKTQLQETIKKQEAMLRAQRNQIKRERHVVPYLFLRPLPIVIW
jgi:hypothetical protein